MPIINEKISRVLLNLPPNLNLTRVGIIIAMIVMAQPANPNAFINKLLPKRQNRVGNAKVTADITNLLLSTRNSAIKSYRPTATPNSEVSIASSVNNLILVFNN